MDLKGNVSTEQLKVGFVFWESELGHSERMTVIHEPVKQEIGNLTQWNWIAVSDSGKEVTYSVTEGHSYYGSPLHDYEFYQPDKGVDIQPD